MTASALQRSSLLRKLALSTASLLLGLLLAEIGVRAFVCLKAGSLYPFCRPVASDTEVEEFDDTFNHILLRDTSFVKTGSPPGLEFLTRSRINSMGFHDTEFSVNPQPGEIRIAVLGDSFVEGLQVPIELNFCNILERRLQEKFQCPVNVINAGTSSYSPLLEYLVYTKRIVFLHPQIVLQVFFANDVFDDVRYSTSAKFDAQGRPLSVASGIPWIVVDDNRDVERSMAFREAQNRIMYERSLLTYLSYLAAWTKQKIGFWRLRRRFPDPPLSGQFFILREEPHLVDAQKRAWDVTRSYIRLLKQECDANNAKFLLSSAPIASQVFGESSSDLFFFRGKPSLADQENLSEIAAQLNVPYIDLLPALKDSGKKSYFALDGHWTPHGHEVVADRLYPYLCSEVLSLQQTTSSH